MKRIKIFTVSILLLAAWFAGAAEIKPLFKLEDMAERFQKRCPSHVKFAVEQDTLVMTISAVELKGGFEGTHSVSIKPLAGRNMTIMLDVRLDNPANPDGTLPHSVGKLIVGGSTQHLLTGRPDWQTYTFKSVKIPGNGLLKIKLAIRNVSGEIRLRKPLVKGDMPKPRGDKAKKKNKNKRNKND